MQVSTLAVKDKLLVAGGFQGELICKEQFHLAPDNRPGVSFCSRTTYDDNAITNAIDIYDSPSGAVHFMASNNDGGPLFLKIPLFSLVRRLVKGKRIFIKWRTDKHSSLSPDGKQLVIVGDKPDGLLVDSNTGKTIVPLCGHLDFSFASAWHPNDHVFVTRNQDKTCRVWDTRYLSKSVSVFKGNLGAVRSIRFTFDGQFMATAELADFVHVYNAKNGYDKQHEIDFFGKISGVSFSPDTDSLFIGGVLTETTAELATSLSLAAARRIVEADEFMIAGLWGIYFKGQTVGVIGAGRIGSAYARMIIEGFKMNLIYYDLYQATRLEKFVTGYGEFLKSNCFPVYLDSHALYYASKLQALVSYWCLKRRNQLVLSCLKRRNTLARMRYLPQLEKRYAFLLGVGFQCSSKKNRGGCGRHASKDVVAAKYDGGMDSKFEFTEAGNDVFSGEEFEMIPSLSSEVLTSAKEEPDASIPPVIDGLLRVHKRTVDSLDADLSNAPTPLSFLKGEGTTFPKLAIPSRTPIQIRETLNGGITLAGVTEPEGRFDHVDRAPKETKELDESKSKKGLTEIYEESLQKKTGFVPNAEEDNLEKEIAPVAVSDVAMLAPEEVFAGKGDIKKEVELTR
ncbi:hypothetical protein GIB67_032112 [Kingdonia uniflora]|uniref:D-isomer specific 2-hydroxyacid dehydrogenase NAD-binding domain-containing protein n=1 Tax=Kingdonia uniflora TaxID=39325 RepID=A0A7J7MWN2_9MAGN|nr:hypothetical protein GIB67_032112 [Kingdonia uniflora]